MIEPLNLYDEINSLIINPAGPEQLSLIACSVEYSFNRILSESGQYRAGLRRRNYICNQTAKLVQLADELYLELRFKKITALARALIMLLQLISRLNALLPGTCRKVMLPKVLSDKAYHQYRYNRQRLSNKLRAQGISDELIGLALIPGDILLKRERIAYKMFCYIRMHLQEIDKLDFTSGSAEAECLLCEKLLSINYNNLQFIDFCVSGFKDALKNLQTLPEKRNFLKAQRKKLRTLATDTCLYYDSRFISAKDSLLKWIGEEIRALNREE